MRKKGNSNRKQLTPKMNRCLTLLGAAGSVVLLLTACSTTKRLADGEALYTGVKKMKIESEVGEKTPGSVVSAVKAPLSVKPNNPLFSPYVRTPLPIGLWAYNYLYTPKQKGYKHWLYMRLAKKPVLISDVQPDLRVKMVEDILDNNGYFNSTARYELLYSKHNPKKARISYRVELPAPFTYGSIEYPSVASPVTRLIDSLRPGTLLHSGSRYSIDTLTAERNRLTYELRNRGYYYFRPEYLLYQADTTQQPLKADMRMVMARGIPSAALKSYRVGQIDVLLQNVEAGPWDTLRYDRMTVVYQKPLKIRRRVLARAVDITPGEQYSVDAQNRTQTNLNKLGIFRYVNLNVTPLDSLKGSDSLNVMIDAAFDRPIEAEFEVDVTSKSNSFLGPGIIFTVSNNNLFRGGEVLALNLKGSYEWQTGKKEPGESSSLLNSYELGINTTLGIPRMLAPRFIPRSSRYPARTTFQLGVDWMNRPKFFHLVSFGGSAGYDFQSSANSYHNLTVFKLVYNNLLSTTESFDKTMEENPAIALSFKDQFIPSMNYTYTFDKTYGDGRNRLFWQNSITQAGNILAGAMGLFKAKKPWRIFGIEFSQFIRNVSEIKFYHRVGRDNWIASRFLVGIGYAYGNSREMPYSEQFYIGGANSIRAFTVRSLGPGSYRPPKDEPNGYWDQTGNFKLEANVEYRFGIFNRLHGAVFLDAGNIWLLKNDPARPGGKLRWKGFWNEIALGTGVGLRYDISYLVLRADLGIGIHTPYKNPDKHGYYNIQSFKDGLGFHLAIGYPF